MKHRYINLMGLAALMTLAGCAKENVDQDAVTVPEGALMVVAEGSGAPGSKVTVDGANVYWQNNEPVRVNDQHDRSLTIEWTRYSSGDKYAAFIRGVDQVASGENYYVMTPPNLIDLTTSELSSKYSGISGFMDINAPREYEYKETTSSPKRQVIDGLPMYGVAASGASYVEMKHLTASINVKITNEARRPVELDYIEVSVSGNRKLSGTYRYQIYKGLGRLKMTEPQHTTTSDEADKKVRMNFANTPTNQRTIGTGVDNTKWVQVPIMPLPKDGQFGTLTIKVYGKTKWDGYEGTTMYEGASPAPGEQFCIEQSVTPTAGHTLYTRGIQRNDLFHAPMTITSADAGTDKGIFTLGSSASAPKGTFYLSRNATPPDNTYRLLSKIELQYLLEMRGDENTARCAFVHCSPRTAVYLCVFPDGVNKSELPDEIQNNINTSSFESNCPYYDNYPSWAKGCLMIRLYDNTGSQYFYRASLSNGDYIYADLRYIHSLVGYTWDRPSLWGISETGWGLNTDNLTRYLYVKELP